MNLRQQACLGLVLTAVLVSTGLTQTVKTQGNLLDRLSFQPDGYVVLVHPVTLDQAMKMNPELWVRFGKLGRPELFREVYIDTLTWLPSLVNGSGDPWLSPTDPHDISRLEKQALRFIRQNPSLFLELDPAFLSLNTQRSGFLDLDEGIAFVDFDVVAGGVPVRGARLVFRINNGRMIQFGAEGLDPLQLKQFNPVPNVTASQAFQTLVNYIGGFDPRVDTLLDPGHLEIIPLVTSLPSPGDDSSGSVPDPGVMEYRLIWVFGFERAEVQGTWVGHVDAHTGRLLAFFDDNKYGRIKGGVYPVSPSNSTETTLPLPFADVRNSSGSLLVYANSGGVYSTTSGTSIKVRLDGQYVKINDNCGSINLTGTANNDLNFGTSGGTDCTTPGFGGAGNTHSARSCFYHVNRIKEKGRSWLPSNSWLQGKLTANVNINNSCNAYWGGGSINFYRSGGGCGNTGEIAAIFLHEYGHGLDSNDGMAPSELGSGEAYGDTVAFLETHQSCIGPGFLTSNCSGYGDSCTNCTGVRDVDYAKHSSNTPATPGNFIKNKCPTSSSYQGPCGREGHCESYVVSESLWDLANRDLPSAGFDAASSWYILDRLFYLSRSTSGKSFNCTNFNGDGCSVSNWYQTFLAVDDNDGNLSNGTPHGNAIYNAFNRHGIACGTAPGNSTSCPSLATPSVTATAGNNSVSLSWSAVSGASKYMILRNDLGCSNGFTKIGETTSTSYTDSTVANDFTFYYRVVAVASSASCFSKLSACQSVTPTGGGTTYSISGTITSSGTGLSGVTVSCSPSCGSTTTNSTGQYTLSGLSNGTYTITPSKSGYTFSPTSKNVTINNNNVTGVDFTATGSTGDVQLTSGVPYNDIVAYHAWKYYYITVPSGATKLVVTTTNASADVDLYTRYNAKPTLTSYLCRPYTASGNETCTHNNPSAGTWWIGVYGYAAGSYTVTATITMPSATYKISGTVTLSGGGALSGVTMTLSGAASGSTTTNASGYYEFTNLGNGSYTVTPSKAGYTFTPTSRNVTISNADVTSQNFTASASSGDVQLSNGVPYNDSITASSRQGSWKYYYFDIASGNTNLVVDLYNLTGDVDLYVKFNSKPTLSSYDCRPYKGGTSSEQCSFATPSAGRWWVGVNNWDTGTINYTVKATWTTGGGGCSALTATYNTTRKAPKCGTGGKSCDSGTLLDSRGNINVPEPNYPNTINNSCTDGNSGSYHSDESIDKIKVYTTDGSCFGPGKSVTVEVTTWCYNQSDSLDLYYTSNAASPTWSYIGTATCSASGATTFTAQITLASTTGEHAFRGNFRYGGSASSCSTGNYDDHDDLIITVP